MLDYDVGMKCFSSMLVGLFLMVPSAWSASLPWGIEAMAGYRTELVHRGFQIADEVYDYQLAAEYALADQWMLGFQGIHAQGSGISNFSELTGIIELRYDEQWFSAGWTLGYRDFQSTFIRDGWESGPFVIFHLSENWDLRAEYLYDQGAESFFGSGQLQWSKAFGNSSFLAAQGGVSYAEDFYGSHGFHNLDARLSYTYFLISNVSVSPFVAASVKLDDVADDVALVGMSFDVTF
ncbi:MAG: hypothetical protein RLZZ224_298 [Verrucomicrobiota bacterium]